MREVGPVDALVLPRAQPGKDGDVGDRVLVAGDVLARGQAPVEDAVEALRLVAVAVDRVRNLLGRVDAEVVRLAEHRADARHLEHQPLERAPAAAHVGRQESAGLGREVHQDRARLEQGDRRAVGAVGVDDRRDLVVRADRQELGPELVAGADIDRNRTVGEAAFLEHDVDLVAVGRGPRIHFDHRVASSQRKGPEAPGARL